MHTKLWTDNCVDTGATYTRTQARPTLASAQLGSARSSSAWLGSARLSSAQTGRGPLHLHLQSKSELWCPHRSRNVPCPQYFQSKTSWWRVIEREPCSALLQSGVESDLQLSQGIPAYNTMPRIVPHKPQHGTGIFSDVSGPVVWHTVHWA